MIPTDLRFFTPAEFKHPELVDEHAARLLDAIRGLAGVSLIVTSDARTAEENATAAGSSPTSWHLKGRAFDLRMPESPQAVYRLVRAVVMVMANTPVELELVRGPDDRHVHLAFPNDGRPSTLEVALT
jgi:hypothetical protein